MINTIIWIIRCLFYGTAALVALALSLCLLVEMGRLMFQHPLVLLPTMVAILLTIVRYTFWK